MREVYRTDPRGTALAAGLQILGALATLGVVGAGKLAFDGILPADPSARTTGVGLTVAMILLASTTALVGSVSVLQAQQQRLLGERVSQYVWQQILDVASRVDLVVYETPGFSTRLERVSQNAISRPVTVTAAILGMSGGLVGIVSLSALLVAVQPVLLPILLAAGVPSLFLSRWASRSEFSFATRMTPLAMRRSYLRQLLGHRMFAAELRTSGSADHLTERYLRIDRTVMEGLGVQVRRRQLLAVTGTLAVGLVLALALLAIVFLVRTDRLSLSEAGAAAIAVRLLSGQLGTVFTAIGSLQECAPFLADLRAFLGAASAPEPRGTACPLRDAVALENISFRYPGGPEPVIDDITLHIAAGEVVALVGENGSGKSTLAKIVAGLYEPDEGELRWDGATLRPADVRASVSVVFQDFVRYQMTVRDNIALGDPDRRSDDELICAAADSAGFTGTLRSLADGIDTVLGRDLDEGTDLSGGQWQRLALARALFRERPLIVLDEPAAALDPRAEHTLFRDVRAVLDGRAALLISHRFSSVRLADRIYVLDSGRIVESGTHDELIACDGQYAELYALQSAAYR